MNANKQKSAQPLVSVIIPCFNCATYIKDALDSVMQQDYAPIEIVIVDDGSTDSSKEVITQYDGPIRFFSQKNQGPAAARNRAVAESKGEYLAFLDGDDIWMPGKLALQMEYILQHPQTHIVYGGFLFWHVDSDSNNYPTPLDFVKDHIDNGLDESLSGWIYHKLLLDSHICIITAVIRRSLFDQLNGFNEDLPTGEDYDFWIRASRLTEVARFSNIFSLYRINKASTTHVPRPENNEYRVLKKHMKAYGLTSPDGHSISTAEIQGRLFQLNFDHAYLHFWHGSACIAYKGFKQAASHTSLNIKLLLYLVLAKLRCLIQGK